MAAFCLSGGPPTALGIVDSECTKLNSVLSFRSGYTVFRPLKTNVATLARICVTNTLLNLCSNCTRFSTMGKRYPR
jgi:hypothetical protein